MNHDKNLHLAIYSTGIGYIFTQVLGFSPEEGTLGQGVASVSGSVKNPELLPWLLITIGTLCTLVLIVRGFIDFFNKFSGIVSSDARLLRKAKEAIKAQTGIDHPIGRVHIGSLFNPTASLGIWMTSKGTWSRALSVTLNPITYLWLLLVSFVKTFFINGGFYLYLTPLLFSVAPLTHGLLALRGISN